MNYQQDPVRIGAEKQVFIDWDMIEPGYGVGWGTRDSVRVLPYEMPCDVRIAVHPPRVDPCPLIVAEHPWEQHISSYVTTLEDDGRFRLYYECYADPLALANYDAMLAYAESDDGITWRKPKVGAVEFNGSKDNNIVFGLANSLGRGSHGATVFKDASAAPAERYKLVHIGPDEQKRRCVFGAMSPDGLHWRAIEQALVTDYESDTQNVVAYDDERKRYVLYCRSWKGINMGRWHGRRCIACSESDRFESFPEPRIMVASDVTFDPDTDFYTNSYHRWPGAANAHLLFPALFHRTRDVLDVHMMVSRDGEHWVRPQRDALIPVGEPGSDTDAGVYAGCGIIRTRPGEWSLPISPQRNTHNQGMHTKLGPFAGVTAHFRRAIWREDGFTSLEAQCEGRCTTVPFVFTGKELHINAWTQFGGEVRIELVDSTEQAHWMKNVKLPATVPRHTMDDCDLLTGDMLNHVVTWRGQFDLTPWAGRIVRLRFYLRRARLHAWQVV
jgi:hypothetical protein